VAVSFFCFDSKSQPAHQQVTPAVSLLSCIQVGLKRYIIC
jgi:hypothetical protein